MIPSMSWGKRLRSVGALAAHRDLALLLAAAAVSQTGDWLLATGVAFEIYALTGSTLASAASLVATVLPQVVLGPIAGIVVDRHDRRRVMIAVDLVAAVALLPLLAAQDAGAVPLVIAVVAANACLVPFFTAAEASLLPALVAEERALITANALNGQVRAVARLAGAALGGLAVATGGLPLVAVVDVVSFAVGAALLAAIRHRPDALALPRVRPVRDWLEVIAAIRGQRALAVLLAFFALAGLGEAVMGTLFAPFVSDVLDGDARFYGIVTAAQAVGGIAGGAVVTAIGRRLDPRLLFGLGALVFGGGDAALFLYHLVVPADWPAVAIIAAVGLPGAALAAGMQTVLQLATAPASRGRVFSALTITQNAVMLLGSGLAGTLAAGAGILPVIVVQAGVYVVGGVLVLVALPTVTARDAACGTVVA